MPQPLSRPAALALLLLAAGPCALACAPAPAPAVAPTPMPAPGASVRQVAVTPESAVIAIGDAKALTARVTYADGSQDARVTWSSTDDAVVKVDPTSGQATGVAAGIALVHATSVVDPQLRATATFTVRPVARP